MNEIKEFTEITMTLKEITDLIGVRHDNAMRIVGEMVKNKDFGMSPKIKDSYKMPNGGVKEIDTYQLNKRQSIAVASRLNVSLLMRVIDKVDELERIIAEQSVKLPDYPTALRELANALDREEANKHLVEFAKAVESADNSIPVGVYSNILKIKGLGRNNMFELFRDSGVLIKSGRRKNTPTQQYIDLEWFEVKETPIERRDGSIVINYTTLITGKGQVALAKKFGWDHGNILEIQSELGE